jgi:Putative Flp pilus-assembly TadE/G-like
MLSPLIRRPQYGAASRSKERGITMALVAVALATIIAMAALSIDIGTLYQAKAEAQRSADAAALTAARLISISGLTGDPTAGNTDGTWADICGGATPYASQAAIKLAQAQQNFVAGAPPSTVNVTYGAGSAGGTAADCSTLGPAFAINPTVTVTVKRTNLPIFFAHIFSLFNSTYSGINVSATATAEAYNSANSASVAGSMIPVQPRCVKPWILPNIDPANPSNPLFLNPFLVATGNGSIGNPGIYPNGVIGESFNINADCNAGGAANACVLTTASPGYSGGVLHYIPAQISGTPTAAVVSGCSTTGYQAAIAGCDQNTVYACGTANATNYDLTENPVYPTAPTGDTATAAACLTNYPGGQDTLVLGVYPFKIEAGMSNPLVAQGVVNDNDVVTTSNSIVTIPIFDSPALTATPLPAQVTIVGFLQVFINSVDTTTTGNVNVTVMNVSGCSNTATTAAVNGTSPVPVRLITPP